MLYYSQLECTKGKYFKVARIKSVSVERLTKWFEDLQAYEHNIELRNLYNINKSEFPISNIEAL